MFKFETPNLQQVFDEIDTWLVEVIKEVEGVACGLAMELLHFHLQHSAQYSGDYAANWKMSVGVPDTNFEGGIFSDKKFPVPKGESAFIRGSRPAIEHALRQAKGTLASFKLGDTIFLSNSAHHTEFYAWKIENNRIKFRPGNYGETSRRAMEEMRVSYGTIPRAKAEYLINRGIGGR